MENKGDFHWHIVAIFVGTLTETLWKHLAEVDEECNEMMDRLVRQMAEKKV